jgi:hypothetical protein
MALRRSKKAAAAAAAAADEGERDATTDLSGKTSQEAPSKVRQLPRMLCACGADI